MTQKNVNEESQKNKMTERKINKKYELGLNHCNCHPETCNCNDHLILKEGEKYVTIFDKEKAEHITQCLNYYGEREGAL